MSRTIESAGVHLPIEEMYLSFLTYKLRNEFGFMESAKTNTPKNDKGEIIPLYTYPCYEWINSIDWSGANVFEYGCGYSSYFWNEKNVYKQLIPFDQIVNTTKASFAAIESFKKNKWIMID